MNYFIDNKEIKKKSLEHILKTKSKMNDLKSSYPISFIAKMLCLRYDYRDPLSKQIRSVMQSFQSEI